MPKNRRLFIPLFKNASQFLWGGREAWFREVGTYSGFTDCIKTIFVAVIFALGRQFVSSPPVLGNITKIPDLRMHFGKSLVLFETPLDKFQEFSEN